MLGDHFALTFKEFIIVVFFKLQVSGVDRIANSEAQMRLLNDSSLIRICTVCIYKHSHISHRLPRDNQRDREQKNAAEINKQSRSKYLSGNNLPRIRGKLFPDRNLYPIPAYLFRLCLLLSVALVVLAYLVCICQNN